MHKMYKSGLIILTFCAFSCLKVVSACERSLEVRGVEDYCWNKKLELSDKFTQTEKKFVNFAKKKLGMDVDEPVEAQKCDYYYCIFQEMKLINPTYDVPCVDRTSNWIKGNVVYNQALVLLERVQNCTGELANALPTGKYFLADNVDLPPEEHIVGDSTEPQSKCEIAAEYMKCLSVPGRNEECPVFQYP